MGHRPEVQPLGVIATDPCTGDTYDVTGYFDSWRSSNSAVAQVTTAQAKAIFPGQATGFADGVIPWYGGSCACGFAAREVALPIAVVSPFFVAVANTQNQGAALCPAGFSGWSRTITAQLQNQHGNAYRVAGINMADNIQISQTQNGLNLQGTNTGTHPTNASGQWPDTYFDCSQVCQTRNAETDATQSWTYNGTALPHVNALVYTCASITVDGK